MASRIITNGRVTLYVLDQSSGDVTAIEVQIFNVVGGAV